MARVKVPALSPTLRGQTRPISKKSAKAFVSTCTLRAEKKKQRTLRVVDFHVPYLKG